jgi:transcriptional regulator with XRE-family HTH domain
MAKPSPKHAGDPVLISLGQAIQDARSEKGLSQEGLANESGVDRIYLGGIERGEHNITVINLLRILRSLGISMSELARRAKI